MMGSTAETALMSRRASPKTAHEQMMLGCFYSAGIIGLLIVYGLLQERIMTIPYPDSGGGNLELFKYSVFLIFLNRLFAVIFALCMAKRNGEELRNMAPLWKYLVVSAANVFASSCQYEALKHVAFVVQMLGKSFKMLPVMLWSLVLTRKTYRTQDWLVAIAVTGGVSEFLLTGPTEVYSHSHHHLHSSSSSSSSSEGLLGTEVVGYLWLLAFLCMDALTSTMQEKLFKDHATSKYNQMLYINGLSSVVSAATLLTTGTLAAAVNFTVERPQFMVDAMVLLSSAVAGQFFIYSQVEMFGALVLAATMNVRQIASILLSYRVYHHAITSLQAFGLIIVFSALSYKSFLAVSNYKKSLPELLPTVDKECVTDTTSPASTILTYQSTEAPPPSAASSALAKR